MARWIFTTTKSVATIDGDKKPGHISVVITNAGARRGVFQMPSAFVAVEHKPVFAESVPYLALVVRELKSGNDEEFVRTSFQPLDSAGMRFSLKPGQGKKLEYPLKSFYRWGACNPDPYGNFEDNLKPGNIELEVRAEFFLIKRGEPNRRVLSNPQKMRCAFPNWLFKGPIKPDPSTGK
jgi:hypothetical protein